MESKKKKKRTKRFRNRVARIRYYEAAMDEVAAAIGSATETKTAAERLRAVKPRVDELAAYYESGLWRRDYEADEKGLLPADLKRGVLSQDGLYDLLAEYDELERGSN